MYFSPQWGGLMIFRFFRGRGGELILSPGKNQKCFIKTLFPPFHGLWRRMDIYVWWCHVVGPAPLRGSGSGVVSARDVVPLGP